MGRLLILIGLVILAVGLIVQFAPSKWWQWIGRLPGDVRIEKENVKIYFPWVSMLLLSVVVSLLLAVLHRLKK